MITGSRLICSSLRFALPPFQLVWIDNLPDNRLLHLSREMHAAPICLHHPRMGGNSPDPVPTNRTKDPIFCKQISCNTSGQENIP
uniref:Uncharacterized protein n=1 Tax=Arundo donax TaxID=35708 RepID=A0A0A9HPG6_ARUDO